MEAELTGKTVEAKWILKDQAKEEITEIEDRNEAARLAGVKEERKNKMLKMFGLTHRLEESHSRSELGEELKTRSVEK